MNKGSGMDPRIIIVVVAILAWAFIFGPWKATDTHTSDVVQKISQDYATKGDVQSIKDYIDTKLATVQLVNNLYYNNSSYSFYSTIIPIGSSTLWITFILFAFSMLVAYANMAGQVSYIPLVLFFVALGLVLNEGHWEFLPLFLIAFALAYGVKKKYRQEKPITNYVKSTP